MKRVLIGLDSLFSYQSGLLNRQFVSCKSNSTRPVVLVTSTGSFGIRFGSTEAHASQWPDNKNPSPYEILQTTPSEFSSRKLKITYYKLARLYHPDSNSHGHICSSNGALLSDKTKAERFKMVVSAYDILRDPKKKVIFDRFGIGWTGVDVTSGYSSAQPSQASHAVYRNHQSDEAFWNAGTWEDYQEHKRRSDSGAFKEQCDNTRWTYLSYVVGGMCVAAFIQIMAILDRTEAHYRYPTGSTVKSLYDLDLVLLNYGWGFAKMDRISRFLAHRDSSGLISHYNPELSNDSDAASHVSMSTPSTSSVASSSETDNYVEGSPSNRA